MSAVTKESKKIKCLWKLVGFCSWTSRFEGIAIKAKLKPYKIKWCIIFYSNLLKQITSAAEVTFFRFSNFRNINLDFYTTLYSRIWLRHLHSKQVFFIAAYIIFQLSSYFKSCLFFFFGCISSVLWLNKKKYKPIFF